MKIGLVVPGGVDRSGTDRSVPCLLWLIERLARIHELHVFALRQEDRPSTYPLLGATVHNIGLRPRRVRALAAIAREHHDRPFDLLHAFWALPQGVIAGVAGRLFNLPVLLHLAGGEVASWPDIGYGDARTPRGRAWLRSAATAATAVTAASAPMLRLARSLGVEARRLPLGVALDRWPEASPRPRSAGPGRVLAAGSINRVKDHATLLQAIALLQRAGAAIELDLVGEDTLAGSVQGLAQELGLSGVRFHGFVSHTNLRAFFERADLLVVSSRHEAGPVAALEAAVAGVPVVGTAVGHVAEWAPHAAIAVPTADPEALADAIGTGLRNDALRLSLASAAQRIALAENADWTADQFLELYERVRHRAARREPSLTA